MFIFLYTYIYILIGYILLVPDIITEIPKSYQWANGEPNFFRPDMVAAGESLNGEPFAFVAIPPGRTYWPGLLVKERKRKVEDMDMILL